MSKEKRKNRLDKGTSGSSSGEFLGFGSFVQAPSLDFSTSEPPTPSSMLWSPIYNGSDRHLSILFKKIGQKRDGATKSKALNDVTAFFEDETQNKKEQVTALTHILFIFHGRLIYDDFSSVRAAALVALDAARRRLPKVWSKLLERHCEVAGMIWCSQADLSLEVKIAAQNLSKSLSSDNWSGVWGYVSRILCYSRPKAMFDDLFARKSGSDAVSDADQEQLDERFERVVGTALSGLQLWVKSFPETETFKYDSCITDAILWKPLTSARNSFRRKAYQLLGTLCLHAKSVVYGPNGSHSLPPLLPSIVAQEKDSTNIPFVFDIILLYMASGESSALNLGQLVKSLNKSLKKACFGSSPLGWAPAILPLLVSIKNISLIESVISSLLEGCKATIGLGDSLVVASAVAECCTYFLIRCHGNDAIGGNVSESFAVCWCKILHIYLNTQGVTPVSKDADLALENMLGKTLCRLNEASFEKDDSGIAQKKDWFWTELLPTYVLDNGGTEINHRLRNLLQSVIQHRRIAGHESHLFSLVRRKFQSMLTTFHSASGRLPSDQEYELLRTCLVVSSATDLFDLSADADGIGMDTFLMNDLLRWIVIHTSRLGTAGGHTATNTQVIHDFNLLRICMGSVVSAHRQRVFWETILREVVAAECDFGLLALGLQELSSSKNDAEGISLIEIVKCEVLDNIAINAVEVEASIQDLDSMRCDKLETFLRTCCGRCDAVRVPLVGMHVWSRWMELAWSKIDDPVVNSILPVLLDLVAVGHVSSLDKNSMVILMTWIVGGDLWSLKASKLLGKPGFEALHQKFLKDAEEELHDSFSVLLDSSVGLPNEHVAVNWSQRAVRWFVINDSLPGHEKFDRMGLADFEMWTSAGRSKQSVSELLFQCTLGFLRGIASTAERFAVLFGNDGRPDRMSLVASMMIAASEPDLRVRRKTNTECHCGALLSLIGGYTLFSDNLVHSCVEAIVQEINDSLLENGSNLWTSRSVNALAEFIGMITKKCGSSQLNKCDDEVNAASLKKGDTVWYITNAESDHSREKAEIVNVHSEDYPRLYFTVRLEIDGSTSERQTVAERLRSRSSHMQDLTGKSELPSNDSTLLNKLGHLLVDRVVRCTLASDDVPSIVSIEAGAVCFRVVQPVCVMLGKPGIGSLQYELVQIVLSLQTRVVQYIETGSFDLAALALRGLAMALGAGEFSTDSISLLNFFRLDPEPSLASLVSLYNSNEEMEVMYLPTLMWTSVATGSRDASELREDVMKMSCFIIRRMQFGGDYDMLFAVNALTNICRSSTGELTEIEGKAVSKLLSLFAVNGCDDDHLIALDEALLRSKPLESLVGELCMNNKSILRSACRENAPRLLGMLQCPRKRWLSFRLLHLASNKSTPLHTDASESMLPQITRSRLKHWKQTLIPDEADELENALLTVFEWVPSDLMVAMESWIEDTSYFDDVPEDTTIARMLGWLIFLQYLESSAAVDSLNRVAFSSYASTSECVFFILSACVMHLQVEVDRKAARNSVATIDDIVTRKEPITLIDLSQTVLFHTVEVFPTLSRGWWEEDCPKALSATVNKFVQLMVAPKTLRRELERINEAMELNPAGEMTVRGSMVSREVTATYQQDECTLSIAIQIPPNFPFRSVDVDGRKTLGISENRVKRWALQMRQILNNQDGTLLDALKLWKRYVEKEFEGVEPCPVCYSVLAVKTHELPNMQCKTCANTFHTSCLQKWFTSSGKSQCVVCQQPWSGVKIS